MQVRKERPDNMATKKFSSFEFASVADTGNSVTPGLHRYDAFKTPYGYAFVIVANDEDDKLQSELSGIALERIRYFLENEPDEKPGQVAKSALIYTSGYLYEFGKRNSSYKAGKISCLCVLYSNEEVFYAWAGHVGLFLFTGKRFYLLNCKDNPTQVSLDVSAGCLGDSEEFMGQRPLIEPHSGESCLQPVSGDKLIMTSGSISQHINTKIIKKILTDNMPLQTKAARIMRQGKSSDDMYSSTIILLRFHDVKNRERKVGPVQKSGGSNVMHEKTDSRVSKNTRQNKAPAKKYLTLAKYLLYTIGFLVVAYFFYDLFINDPRPPINLSEIKKDTVPEETAILPDSVLPEQAPVLPDDLEYTVRSGDTWSRIYSQYGVCSWFIRNHPPNTGRFGSEGSLIAGQRLQIPVQYSRKPEFNPHYYSEFSTEKVGSRCENVNEAFLEAFKQKIRQ